MSFIDPRSNRAAFVESAYQRRELEDHRASATQILRLALEALELVEQKKKSLEQLVVDLEDRLAHLREGRSVQRQESNRDADAERTVTTVYYPNRTEVETSVKRAGDRDADTSKRVTQQDNVQRLGEERDTAKEVTAAAIQTSSVMKTEVIEGLNDVVGSLNASQTNISVEVTNTQNVQYNLITLKLDSIISGIDSLVRLTGKFADFVGIVAKFVEIGQLSRNFKTNIAFKNDYPDRDVLWAVASASEVSRPCFAVGAAGRLFVVDCYAGTLAALQRCRAPVELTTVVLLTRSTETATEDLPELYASSNPGRIGSSLAVYGSRNTQMAVDHINRANGWTNGDKGLCAWGPAPALQRDTVVFDTDGLKVTAFVIPDSGAQDEVGFRFDFRGQSLLVCANGTGVAPTAGALLAYDGVRVAGRVYSAQQAPQLVHLNAATSGASVRDVTLKEARPTVTEPTVLRERSAPPSMGKHCVTCLGCSAQLECSTDFISGAGSVLCINCGHSWFIEPGAPTSTDEEVLDEVLLDEPLADEESNGEEWSDDDALDDEDSGDEGVSDEELLDELLEDSNIQNENVVVCPHCATRFYFAASRIGGGCTVRCAACGFAWFLEPKSAKRSVGPPSPVPTMGAVLLVQDYPGLFLVRDIVSAHELVVDYARPSDYKITRGLSVEDASPTNDWSKVKILHPETGWKSYEALGFLGLSAV